MAERKYQFERLTPIDNMDLDVYGEAIDYVFDNSDIKNVAISGAYSAGKSSVLASYKKKHSNLRFLHISLAHFKSPGQEDEAEVKESVLEGKILNQLIHQIPSEKIPQTNFRVKKKVNKKSVIRLTIGAVLFLVSTIYFFCFDMWKNYLSSLPDNWFKTILTPSTHQYALMVDGVLMVALLSFVVYRLISIQKNKNIFRKLNLKGNEIEIFEESDDSYFDKYLNEVLYLFENADADVIVFEDMDRFNFHYCYLLGIFPKNKPKQNRRRLHFLLREDLRKLDDITAETRLLVRNRIDTAEQLFSYRDEAQDKIAALTAERKQLYKLQRTAAVKADPEKSAEIKDRISALSKELATLRKEVSLCDDIAERSGVIKEKIKAVREDEHIKGKEKTDHVQFR